MVSEQNEWGESWSTTKDPLGGKIGANSQFPMGQLDTHENDIIISLFAGKAVAPRLDLNTYIHTNKVNKIV